jgi:hypothetical protein
LQKDPSARHPGILDTPSPAPAFSLTLWTLIRPAHSGFRALLNVVLSSTVAPPPKAFGAFFPDAQVLLRGSSNLPSCYRSTSGMGCMWNPPSLSTGSTGSTGECPTRMPHSCLHSLPGFVSIEAVTTSMNIARPYPTVAKLKCCLHP